MVKIIDSTIRKGIQMKLEKIAGDPKYYDNRKELVINGLRSMADVYSFWIENPGLRKALLIENRQPKTLRKEARAGIQAVRNGWYYLNEIVKQHGELTKTLNPLILKRLNGLVQSKKKGKGDFRTYDVTLNIGGYTPISPRRIPEKVKNMISRVKGLYVEDPVESAVFAHLSIAALQPFDDGNKRTARLIQDRILFDAELPPAIIPAGEGQYYFNLLSRTVIPYRDNDLDGQKDFYNYCASKVNNGLDEVLGDLFEEAPIVNSH